MDIHSRLSCSCQQSKIHRHIKAPLVHENIPERRFDHIHIDLVGPLPPSRGYTYLLTIVDRFTQWPEAIPLSDISTLTCARALLGELDFSFRYAAPHNNRQRTPIYFPTMVRLSRTAGDRTSPNNGLLPASKWFSGTLSQTAQSFPESPSTQPQLER